jgi:dynein heavy chain, axonemal
MIRPKSIMEEVDKKKRELEMKKAEFE